MLLANQVALITGSGHGIGHSIALPFASRGWFLPVSSLFAGNPWFFSVRIASFAILESLLQREGNAILGPERSGSFGALCLFLTFFPRSRGDRA
jgi:hypothetical protein